MFADQLLVSTGQELTTMKLQTYPTNSSLRKQPFCETSPAARSEERGETAAFASYTNSPCYLAQNFSVGAYNENIHTHSMEGS